MKRKQQPTDDHQSATDDPVVQIDAMRREHAAAKRLLGKRQSQLTAVEETAKARAQSRQHIESERTAELIPARCDDDAEAQARLAKFDEQLWRAEREERDALATAAELRREIKVAEYKVARSGKELARLENRLGDEQNTQRRQRILAAVAEHLLPPLRELIAELDKQTERSQAAGIEEWSQVTRYDAVADELWEAISAGVSHHRTFSRTWGRPSRGARSRIPELPTDDPATAVADDALAAIAAAEVDHTTTH